MDQNDQNFIDIKVRAVRPEERNISSEDGGEVISKMEKLESENRKMQMEFNTQRAKMKDLFLQKETELNKCQEEKHALQRELNEMKSEVLLADMKSKQELQQKDIKAQEEISSLQQLVQDTIEESTICKTELSRLKEECQRLRQDNRELRDTLHNLQEPTSLGPQVLNQVKKTLVRKLGGDPGSPSTTVAAKTNQDNFDENAKMFSNKYADENSEFFRSLVIQLKEEMEALKGKLREADEELQNRKTTLTLNSVSNDSKINHVQENEVAINKSTSMDVLQCVKCNDYETKVQDLLKQKEDYERKIDELQKCMDEANECLEKEAVLRRDLENQWQEKREIHKAEVQQLQEQVKRNENTFLDLQQKFLETKEEVITQLQRLGEDRERVNAHLDTLQADNDFLSGQYLATAEEIESQYINLPNTVEELQELMLRQRDELIQARLSSQFEHKKCVTLSDEIKILREQLSTVNEEWRMYKKKMHNEIKSLEERLKDHLLTQQNHETTRISLERKEAELNREISELRVEIIELQEKIEKLNKINGDYKAKIFNLQTDLSNSEEVQKDFVQLSQRLQVELEKLRTADTQVRWKDDDDIDNCPICGALFTVTVRKIHCRHCGDIYCDRCLTKSVPSGPGKRPARVCDICHTLLQPHLAPYFSHEPQEIT